MSNVHLAAALAEAQKVHGERVAALKHDVDNKQDPEAKRELLLQLLRLQSLWRPSLRVRRGFLAFAQHAQIHAGGGSFKHLRLTLFIATHTNGKAFSMYEDDEQTHGCHFLFDCCLYEQGLRAVFFYRHLSPDAGAHYKVTSPGRAKILDEFLRHVLEAELKAAEAGSSYTLDSDTVLMFAKRLYRDAWGSGKAERAEGVPPWVPAAVRAR